MEVVYELLWKVCSGVLVSFLVYGLVSLILYRPSSSLDDEKMVKSEVTGGKKKKKRVKFVDRVDVIRRVDDGFVRDIEVDEVHRLVGGEKDEVLMGVSGDGCVGLVDLGEKDETLVGSDVSVVDDCVDVGVCLGSDVVDNQREENSMNSSVELGIGENSSVSLASGESVDGHWERNSVCSSSVYEEEVHVVDRVDKVVGSDVGVSLGSDELVDDHRKGSLGDLTNVYEDVHVIDRVDKVVGCDDVSLGSASLVDDHREGSLGNSSNVYEERVHDVDRVDKTEDDHDIDLVHGKEEVIDEEAKAGGNVGSEGGGSGGEFDGEGMLNDEEEWEGIERSDLAGEFAQAKRFVENDENLAMVVGNDLMMELYGLEKVAMEGPCHEPQPMALKFAARAKWNAWQKLGNMSPEEAMEQYISVLSQTVPKWMEGHSSEESKSPLVEDKVHDLAAHTSTSLDQESGSTNLRTSKDSDLADVSAEVDQDKE